MCETVMHANAPEGHKCSDCTMDGEACPDCYMVWWRKRHPNTSTPLTRAEARLAESERDCSLSGDAPVLVLTAWVSVNPVSKPALMEPVECVRKTDYDALYNKCVASESENEVLREQNFAMNKTISARSEKERS